MDSSFGYPYGNQSRSPRLIDGKSQVSGPPINIKQVDIPCSFHADEQSMNYCTEPKCHQPLCSECIEDHLLLHKKHGFSDLGIKSLRGTRKECAFKLGALIDQLLKRLGQLDAPPAPQQQLESLENKLEALRTEIHEIVEMELNRIRESLRLKISQSANMFKAMGQIHSRLEAIIEQLQETHVTLVDGGKRGGTAIPDCIRKTLTLDVDGLMNTFISEGSLYDNRRRGAEFDLLFQENIIARAVVEAVKVISPQHLNTSGVSQDNKQSTRTKVVKYEEEEDINSLLPHEAKPRGNASFLHFFETGSNKLHLVQIQNRKKGISKIVNIDQFLVPSFHASIAAQSGEYIFLSGGIVELNGGSKSPMFVRYSIRNNTTKKDFARVKPRSSHSLCQDANGDIFILGGYGPSEYNGGEPTFQTSVERVNQRSGKVQLQTESNWGGSNLAIFCRNHVVKACDEGVELYNPRTKQWIVADTINRPKLEYNFFKSAGYASLNQNQFLTFGGYNRQSVSSDACCFWKVAVEGNKARVSISKLNSRVPMAQGFENSPAMVDEQGVFALQNIEDGQSFCVDNQRRLVRFNLQNGSGEWKILEIEEEEEEP